MLKAQAQDLLTAMGDPVAEGDPNDGEAQRLEVATRDPKIEAFKGV